jgi:hypothetical protein
MVKRGARAQSTMTQSTMERDPAKRITAFGIGVLNGEVRAVLLVNDADPLVVVSNGLNHDQAELLCDGYVDGLRESAGLPVDMIEAFLNDPIAIAALEVPLDRNPADRELFKQGAIGGLRLAAAGYWIDTGEAAEPRTIH